MNQSMVYNARPRGVTGIVAWSLLADTGVSIVIVFMACLLVLVNVVLTGTSIEAGQLADKSDLCSN
jgi:hypothetical protein